MEKPAPEFADLLEPLQQLQAPSGCFKVFKVDGGLALLTPKNCSKFVVKLKLPTSEEKKKHPKSGEDNISKSIHSICVFFGWDPLGDWSYIQNVLVELQLQILHVVLWNFHKNVKLGLGGSTEKPLFGLKFKSLLGHRKKSSGAVESTFTPRNYILICWDQKVCQL